MSGSLRDSIITSSVECLNQDDHYGVANAFFDPDPSCYLQSFMDSELLVKCAFHQAVRLERINLSAAKLNNAWDLDAAPSKVKIFINNMNMGFDDVESYSPIYEAVLKKEDYNEQGVTSLAFNLAKFRNVQAVTLFFESTCGEAEVTRIGLVDIIGKPVECLNMQQWKPVEKDQRYAVEDT